MSELLALPSLRMFGSKSLNHMFLNTAKIRNKRLYFGKLVPPSHELPDQLPEIVPILEAAD